MFETDKLCPKCEAVMVHAMPMEEQWNTATPPVVCPQCGATDVLTIDPNDSATVSQIGHIMAQLVQAKRDQHNADHLANEHTTEVAAIDSASTLNQLEAVTMTRYCHYCRDAAIAVASPIIAAANVLLANNT